MHSESRVFAIWDPRRRTWVVYRFGVDDSIGPVLLKTPGRCTDQVRIFGIPRIKEERVDECECARMGSNLSYVVFQR